MKKIEYINTSDPIVLEKELTRLFELTVQARDLTQELTESILHLKASIDATALKRTIPEG